MSDWSSGICGCFEDIGICAITYFCPCVTAGRNAEAVGESCFLHGFFSTLGCIGIYCGATIRGKIREKYAIPGSFGNDCVMHWFCPLCAYAQEARILVACGYSRFSSPEEKRLYPQAKILAMSGEGAPIPQPGWSGYGEIVKICDAASSQQFMAGNDFSLYIVTCI